MLDAPQRATCLALQAEPGPIRTAQWRETHVQEDTLEWWRIEVHTKLPTAVPSGALLSWGF